MRYFDCHCDTVSTAMERGASLWHNDLQLSVEDRTRFTRWVQVFAFWIDDRYYQKGAWEHFLTQYHFWESQCRLHKEGAKLWSPDEEMQEHFCHMLLSIEGGHVLEGDVSRIPLLKEKGITFFTLVWNGQNELASGIKATGGLTKLGRQAVRLLEEHRIIVDVSHLNEQGFWEVADCATRPFVATHSNAHAICPHPRNLTDDQIRCIVERGGLIGLNFYPLFVTGKDDCSLQDLCRHIERILSLGGEGVLAMGSDFDGATMPSDLGNCQQVSTFYREVEKQFGTSIAEKIFYDNAVEFLTRQKG